jgi:hypothetical protein
MEKIIPNQDKTVERYAVLIGTYEGENYSLNTDSGKHLESIFYALLDIEENMLSPKVSSIRNSLLEELVNKKIKGLI